MANQKSKSVPEFVPEILTFHPTTHQRIAFSADLRTVMSKNSYGFLCAVTSRRLHSNEKFSFILNDWRPGNSVYFGVRQISGFYPNCNSAWFVRVYGDGFTVVENGDLYRECGDYIKVGYHYSVVRKSNGDVRFAVNGRDFGIVFRNVPEKVYGFVKIKGNTMLTIF